MVTKVIFRKWRKDEEVIALFPEIPADYEGHLCQSYARVGQHGGADRLLVMRMTVPAKLGEYTALKQELEGLGYSLKIGKRTTRKDREVYERVLAEAKKQDRP